MNRTFNKVGIKFLLKHIPYLSADFLLTLFIDGFFFKELSLPVIMSFHNVIVLLHISILDILSLFSKILPNIRGLDQRNLLPVRYGSLFITSVLITQLCSFACYKQLLLVIII